MEAQNQSCSMYLIFEFSAIRRYVVMVSGIEELDEFMEELRSASDC